MILVLVADDEPMSRKTVARLLKRRFDTLEASSGTEVIAILLARKDVDVLITDYTMPRGGEELFRRVRMVRPTLPVILLTGHDPDNFDGMGYDAVLEKPVNEQDLFTAITRLVGGV